METEEQRDDQTAPGEVPSAEDQSPEEFAAELESDQAYNPDDGELKREKGG
jgi:hypothetical protein